MKCRVMPLLAVLGCVISFIVLQEGCSRYRLDRKASIQEIPVTLSEGYQWPDKKLAERFQQYWSIRKTGESAELKEFEAPHVLQIISPVVYERTFGNRRPDWISIRMERIQWITNQLVEIDFFMQIRNQDASTEDVFYRDSWLMFSNKWMHVIKDPFLTGDGLGR